MFNGKATIVLLRVGLIKRYLSNLKSKVDQLDIDWWVPVPKWCSKKMMLLKKMYKY